MNSKENFKKECGRNLRIWTLGIKIKLFIGFHRYRLSFYYFLQGLGLDNLRWVEINHGFRGSLIFVEGKSIKDMRKCTNFLPLFIGSNVRIPFQLISNDTAQFSIA